MPSSTTIPTTPPSLRCTATRTVLFLDEPFTDEALAFAIRKDDPDFLAWLNEFLQRLNADGRYERIRSKWFESTEWFGHYRQ